MKLTFSRSTPRGLMLIECLVYLVVFMILLGVGFSAFYVIWDNSKALRRDADAVATALRAGETWRADVRSATGKIQAETSPDGVMLNIPRGKDGISYRFSGDTVYRKSASAKSWMTVMSRVKLSQMEPEERSQVKAWHWDLELMSYRARVKVPLEFSFEAVAPPKS